MKKAWTSLVNGVKSLLTIDSKLSSKRFVAIIGFLFLGIALFVNLFIGKVPADSLVYSVAGLVGTAMGVTGAEKFSKADIFQAPKKPGRTTRK
jgi:O-antigen ligase